MPTSENAGYANFAESPKGEVRRIPQPVEKVVMGQVGSPKAHPNTWTSTPKRCYGGVFESLKGARKGRRGVFQQAEIFCELRLLGLLIEVRLQDLT
jgi:hypothetical protein